MRDGMNTVALHGSDRDVASVAVDRRTTEEGRKVLDPVAESTGGDPLGVVLRIVQDAEDVVGQELRNGKRHPREALHEEVDGLLAVKLKRRAHA